MLNKLLVLSLFSIISFPVFSETYVCSQELSRYGRPGEIETTSFKREGDSFVMIVDETRMGRETFYESDSTIILLGRITYTEPEPEIGIFIIGKKTKEYGSVSFGISEFKKSQPEPFGYGKCIVVN